MVRKLLGRLQHVLARAPRPVRSQAASASARRASTSLHRSSGKADEGFTHGNKRGPIYAQIQAALKRHLTPDEKTRLDRYLDSIGIGRRFT